MADPCTIQPLDASSIPSPDDLENPGFTDLFNELVGDAGTAADGYDQDLADGMSLLDAIAGALDQLGGAEGGTLDDAFEEISTVDPQEIAELQAAHAAALPAGDQAEKDLGDLLAAAAAPAPPSGGGSAAPSSDCSKRTNQYGLSKTGSFAGVHCDWSLTFQVIRVQDGPCTYSAQPSPAAGANAVPTIVAFSLQSGDTRVWQLAFHTAHAPDGTPFDVIDVKITPAAPGHYDAVGLLFMQNPGRTWHVCMSVDVIP